MRLAAGAGREILWRKDRWQRQVEEVCRCRQEIEEISENAAWHPPHPLHGPGRQAEAGKNVRCVV